METAKEIINNIMVQKGLRHKRELAEYFGVSPQALSIWIAKNQIPPKHLLKISKESPVKKTINKLERYNDVLLSESKTELKSVINYLMRENIFLKNQIKELNNRSKENKIHSGKNTIFDKIISDFLYISGRVSDGVITSAG